MPATGKAGRVLKEDILSFLELQSGASTVAPPVTSSSTKDISVPIFPASQGDRTEDLSAVKKAMAKTMTEAWVRIE